MRLSELAALHPGGDPEILIASDNGYPTFARVLDHRISGFLVDGDGAPIPFVVITFDSNDEEED